MASSVGTEYEDIWEIVREQVDISREEFDKKVNEVYSKGKAFLTKRAAAIIVAKKLNISTQQILYTPIIGRLLEVGATRMARSARGETPYVLFTIVNEQERIPCVAFGEKHISTLKKADDKVVRLKNYLKAKLQKYSITKITEESIIEILDDNALPPITDLKPAWAESLKDIKERRGTHIVKVLVIDESSSEYLSCPICGKTLEFVSDEWLCPEHGSVEPETKTIRRYILSDRSGTFPAVYFGTDVQESILNRLIVAKGYFRNDEFQIQKIYWISDNEII